MALLGKIGRGIAWYFDLNNHIVQPDGSSDEGETPEEEDEEENGNLVVTVETRYHVQVREDTLGEQEDMEGSLAEPARTRRPFRRSQS